MGRDRETQVDINKKRVIENLILMIHRKKSGLNDCVVIRRLWLFRGSTELKLWILLKFVFSILNN